MKSARGCYDLFVLCQCLSPVLCSPSTLTIMFKWQNSLLKDLQAELLVLLTLSLIEKEIADKLKIVPDKTLSAISMMKLKSVSLLKFKE